MNFRMLIDYEVIEFMERLPQKINGLTNKSVNRPK